MRVSPLIFAVAASLSVAGPASAQVWLNADTSKKVLQSSFRALEDWPVPNDLRRASGAPGAKYWQQQADYVIKVSLDTTTHRVTGSEVVTYHNNSPDKLTYIWFQLDQNIEKSDSRANMMSAAIPKGMDPRFRRFLMSDTEFGYTLSRVQLVDAQGKRTDARYTMNGTQMRVNLAAPLGTGQTVKVAIDWSHEVPNGGRNGRGQKEKLKDGWEYLNAQWFPRVAVYDDVNGWQNNQFLGMGEFYLQFGNYDVSITVPRDHIVRSTGTLQNPNEVLTATQRARLKVAFAADTPVYIIKPEEIATPATRPAGSGNLTWHFTAQNVRDFAWASSRGFAWDAMGFRYAKGGKTIELHSVYPREGMPVWNKISTKAIAQTMVTYGRMAFEYPYPQASNVHGAVGGMEYPMIAFCGARPRPDGTYDKSLEYSLAAVTIHEVGHNWFPMIVASDERMWTWMDEGLNSFLEHYGSIDFDKDWPAMRLPGNAKSIANYMRMRMGVPIMAHSDVNLRNTFGSNGYSKPASGLVILRERISNPVAFDEAFRGYSQRWMFKHPQPADFFRSMEDGLGEQLNWFWRGWFYTGYNNDQALTGVERQNAKEVVGDESKGTGYFRITIEQQGGIVMPVEMEITYTDGTKERVKLPADIWRANEKVFNYGKFSNKDIAQVIVDPDEAYADVNRANNTWKKPAAAPLP
ncbi:MAG: M1 family metallopeptidase [Gemmatimonadaceae bacterium]|nr:M1 family metallopeptidase [Gemmatimonadaceae bacterium]